MEFINCFNSDTTLKNMIPNNYSVFDYDLFGGLTLTFKLSVCLMIWSNHFYTLPFNDFIKPFNVFSFPFNDSIQSFNAFSFPFHFFYNRLTFNSIRFWT